MLPVRGPGRALPHRIHKASGKTDGTAKARDSLHSNRETEKVKLCHRSMLHKDGEDLKMGCVGEKVEGNDLVNAVAMTGENL